MIFFFFRILSIFFRKNKKLPRKLNKILIFRQGGIGDVINTTPLVRFLKKIYPKAKIDYLVGEWSKDVLTENPDINRVISFSDDIIYKKKYIKLLELAKQIRANRYDIIFNCNKSWMYNVLVLFFCIPFRIGFDRYREGFCNTHNVFYDGKIHEIDYYVKLASFLTNKKAEDNVYLYSSKKEKKKVSSVLKKLKLNKNKIVCLGPGGSYNPGDTYTIRRFPFDKYLELITNLIKDFNIFLIGGKKDIALNNKFISSIKNSKNKIVNFAGKLNIKESYALLKKCHLYIGHISGQLHLADASGIPIISINGPLAYYQFSPKRAVNFVSHKPCYDVYGHYNLPDKFSYYDDIKVSNIEAAARKILKKK